jgi:hypothetical protein
MRAVTRPTEHRDEDDREGSGQRESAVPARAPEPDPAEPHDVLAAEEFVVPAPDPDLHADERADEPHDVLAAEEFVVPAPDPVLHESSQPAHDVLAAEEFEVGSADPALHHRPPPVPPDPSGIEEPHDVLAAEEFAVPAGAPGGPWSAGAVRGPRAGGGARAAAILAAGASLAMWLRRRRR